MDGRISSTSEKVVGLLPPARGLGGFIKNSTWSLIDEVRMNNGNYQDGYAPVN